MQLAATNSAVMVRVDDVRPGLIRTELVARSVDSPELGARITARFTPLPRAGQLEDMANVAMFLLSDAASYVTGQIHQCRRRVMLRRGPDFGAMLEPVFGADGLRGVV